MCIFSCQWHDLAECGPFKRFTSSPHIVKVKKPRDLILSAVALVSIKCYTRANLIL